jgi:hypothetical protein
VTDARLPARWLYDRRIQRLPDRAHRLFVNALMWAVENRTEGVLLREETDLLQRFDEDSADAIVKAGLWEEYGTGWVITVFEETQTTRLELEANDARRRRDRDKKRRQRARKAAAAAGDVPGDVPGDVREDTPRPRTRPRPRPG